MDRAALLRLSDDACRDPSASRHVVEQIAQLVQVALASSELEPQPGYLYAPAHRWIALAEAVHPEPFPTAALPNATPLTSTINAPVSIKAPWDALVVAVAGWAIPQIPFPAQIVYADRIGVEQMAIAQDGRDLFSTRWDLNGANNYTTDGQSELMEPAAVMVGTELSPRRLAWRVPRNQIINVYFRNLSNLIYPGAIIPEQAPGFDLTCALVFHAFNLEAP